MKCWYSELILFSFLNRFSAIYPGLTLQLSVRCMTMSCDLKATNTLPNFASQYALCMQKMTLLCHLNLVTNCTGLLSRLEENLGDQSSFIGSTNHSTMVTSLLCAPQIIQTFWSYFMILIERKLFKVQVERQGIY